MCTFIVYRRKVGRGTVKSGVILVRFIMKGPKGKQSCLPKVPS